ncbi:cupin domain-containing protein [Nostoc sp. UHCC 0702]|nr:cupin domain-containing protein [Nostoc sp. UHCC 0702]
MKVIEFSREHAKLITQFETVSASSVHIGDGVGEAHVYCIYFEPNSAIGRHQAGYGQLFLVISGEGWASGEDNHRVQLSAGQGAYFERGEFHSKGSDTGMTVIMVQVSDINPQTIHIISCPFKHL